MQSEYFDKELTINQQINNVFPTVQLHMKNIIQTFNLIKRLIIKKEEIPTLDKISSATFDMSTQQINESFIADYTLTECIDYIIRFYDVSFSYFIRVIDSTSPVYKLPNTLLKFNLICDVLNITSDYAELYEDFKLCLTDDFILDIYKDGFLIRNELPYEELKTKIITLLNSHMKVLLLHLLKFKKET